jgi:hypothetical protein
MKLSQKEFDSLIKKAECTEWDLTGTIAFDVSLQFYSIGFYGECKDNFNLVVDEFLKKVKGKWIECEPTEYQRLVMQAKIVDKRKELDEQQAFDSQEVESDYYDTLGVKPRDFY